MLRPSHGSMLRPVHGLNGSWAWTDPEYAGGPGEYLQEVRFASRELARRFHEEWI